MSPSLGQREQEKARLLNWFLTDFFGFKTLEAVSDKPNSGEFSLTWELTMSGPVLRSLIAYANPD